MKKMESPGERSADQKEVDKSFHETICFLERKSILNLTNIELINLRKDIENIFEENKSLDTNKMTPASEAVHRFFIHYGIDLKDFPWGEHQGREKSWEYIKRAVNKAREESHRP